MATTVWTHNAMDETSEQAILREIREEVEIDVKINRLLWTVENFFTEEQSGDRFHELGLYYLLELKDDSIFERGSEFSMTEGGKHDLRFYWKPLEDISTIHIYPLFLKEKIMSLSTSIEHIIEIK